MSYDLKKKKIVFFINTPTSYQDEFFTELNKYLNVRVFFYSRSYKNYNFKIKNKKNYYFSKKEKNNITNYLELEDPNFIVMGGYRLPNTNEIIRYCEKKNKRYFFWLERLNTENRIKLKIVKLLISKKIRKSNGVLAVGEEAKRFYGQFNPNIINLPYSINVNSKIKKQFFYKNKINFVFVGQVIKRKGIDLILHGFSNLDESEKENISLKIIGNGLMKKEIDKIKKKNKFIHYCKFLNKEKLNKVYEKSDVFIFPSRFDGWGVAPMEAMTFSNSVIVSSKVGMKEILQNKNQIIEISKYELIKTIKKLINNKILIQKYGKFNKNCLLNSLCNVKNSSKHLFNYLRKINL